MTAMSPTIVIPGTIKLPFLKAQILYFNLILKIIWLVNHMPNANSPEAAKKGHTDSQVNQKQLP